jgi:hypothetical protein
VLAVTTIKPGMVKMFSPINLATFYGTTSICGISSFALGAITTIIWAVSKYALPKLGFQSITGIPVTRVSREAFAVASVFFTLSAVSILASLAVQAIFFPNGFNDF